MCTGLRHEMKFDDIFTIFNIVFKFHICDIIFRPKCYLNNEDTYRFTVLNNIYTIHANLLVTTGERLGSRIASPLLS